MAQDRSQRQAPNTNGLDALLAPRSVAIVGASCGNPTSFGSLALRNLVEHGYPGEVFVVHPTEPEVAGHRCHRSIESIPSVPDLCVLALRAELVPDLVRACADRGVRAVTVVGSGFAESDTADGVRLQNEIAAIARASGMRVLGPNTLGSAGIRDSSVPAASANIPPDLVAGTVGIVSQSGGLGTTILAATARYGLGVDAFVAVGNEVDVSAADVIAHYVDRGVSAVLCYVETLRDPHSFGDAARRAAERGIPVVLLQGGTQPRGQAVTAAHTASLAGSTRVLDSVLATWSVARVSSIDALVATGALFSRFGAAVGLRCGVLGLGGGNSALLADALETGGIPLATLTPEAAGAIRTILPDSNASNPLDPGGWFLGKGPHLLGDALEVLVDDDGVDLLIAGMVPLAPIREDVYVGAIADVAARSELPVICLSGHTPSTTTRASQFAAAGVLELPCTEAATEALSCWHRLSVPRLPTPDVLADSPVDASHSDVDIVGSVLEPAAVAALRETGRLVLLEDRAIALLEQFGVSFPDLAVTDAVEPLADAADAIGYPVVVKALADGLLHRAQHGAVAIDIRSRDELVLAAHRVHANAETATPEGTAIRLLVQRQIERGTEMIVGIQRDPVFGPVVLLGLGGVWSELLDDVAFALPPISNERGREMIAALRAAAQLRRLVEAGAFDEAALLDLLSRVGDVALALGAQLESVDLNPVIVGGQGIGLVDALVVLSEPEQ